MKISTSLVWSALALISFSAFADGGKLEGTYTLGNDCVTAVPPGSPVIMQENFADHSPNFEPQDYTSSNVVFEMEYNGQKGLLEVMQFVIGKVNRTDPDGSAYVYNGAYSADGRTITQVTERKDSEGLHPYYTKTIMKTPEGLQVKKTYVDEPEEVCTLHATNK